MKTAMFRVVGAMAAVLLTLATPATVSAHALSGSLMSPLPLVVYLAGAAIAVGLSFAFVMLFDVVPRPEEPRPVRRVPRWLVLLLRSVGLIAWLWIVAQLVVGGSSNADVASLFLWVYGWVGLAIVSALIGPVWTWLNPFATLFDIGAWVVRRLGVRPWQPASFPPGLETWPAVAGLAFFIWLELAYFLNSPAVVMVGYTVVTLAAMAQFGRDRWLERGETFSVWFATLGRLAPFVLIDRTGATVRRRGFASGLIDARWTLPLVVLIALGTGSILFDGISQTAPWTERFGFPGVGIATVLLAVFLAVVVGVVLAVARMVGIATVGAGVLPIAVGYLIAHYLTFLLADGQRLIVALSDPLQLGWDLLGTAFYQPDTSWLPPSLVWSMQLGSVVGGHIVGAWAGHAVAARKSPDRAALRRREVPLAALMVALTATTLWSLGQAIVVDPVDQPAPAAIESSP